MAYLRLIRLAVIFLILSLFLPACGLRPAVKIGFAAQLSGKQSELGSAMRNGVQLAVEQVNAAGGIRGRPIQLLIEDDRGDPKGARAAETRLADSGAVAVIGHLTSSQTLAGFEAAAQRGVLLLSPSASTDLLSGKKDLFMRTTAAADWLGAGLADYISVRRKVSRVAIIMDADNLSYSQPLADSFRANFQRQGGQISGQVRFSAAQAPDFAPLVAELRAGDPAGVLIVASPVEAALIAQAIALQGWRPALFAASWAQGESLIRNGGKTVEGLEIIIILDINDPAPALLQFKSDYEDRFGDPPVFTAMLGYETMRMLAEALQVTGGSAAGLPEALSGLRDFHGLTGPLSVDEYGDATRPLYIQRVTDGKFITIDALLPQD